MSETAIIAISFLLGTFWGSFFYTLALRYAAGEMGKAPLKALFSRSRCPSCHGVISPLLLVPLAGYLVRRGRCAFCGNRISPLYPASELLYGAMAALFAWKLGASPLTFFLYLIAALALSIALVDVMTLTIPDSMVVAFAILSLYPVVLNYNFRDNLFGLLALFALFIVILLLFPGSFGGGDVKFAAAIGFLCGLELSLVVLEVSLVSGALIGVSYALTTKKGLRTKIPFAPFLSLGLIISLLYGREILLVYYRVLY
ncbi:MAG: prepilin peptidase [Spirochaetes bacterium]|nr:prepilin peptidase [Spirochaetota bacterium]